MAVIVEGVGGGHNEFFLSDSLLSTFHSRLSCVVISVFRGHHGDSLSATVELLCSGITRRAESGSPGRQ